MTAETNGPGREPIMDRDTPLPEVWVVWGKDGVDFVAPLDFMAQEHANEHAELFPEAGPWRVHKYTLAAPPAPAPRFCPNGRECFRQHLLDRADEMIKEMDEPTPAPAPAPDADAAKMVSDWLTHAKSCGRGIQEMVRVEGAEIIMTGLLAQVECNRIDLNDARGTIRRQRERIEQQTRELADTRHALIAQARQWQERAKRAEADLAAVGAAIKETK